MQGKVCEIIEGDGFGLWIFPEGDEWSRAVGIPWAFIAAIEIEWEEGTAAQAGERRRRIGF